MTTDQFPIEALGFQAEAFQGNGKAETVRGKNFWFHRTQLADNICKIVLRAGVSLLVAVILCYQNWMIFSLINKAIEMNIVQDLQLFLGTLLTGTLTATYYTLNLIIGFLNKEIDHKPHSK